MLNANLSGLGPSATLAINERSAALQAQGRRVYKLGLGQSPFPVPECVVQSLRDHAHQKDYLAVRGLASLRAAIADFHGLERTASDVLIGPGSKELMFLVQLAYEGTLCIPSPSWVSYEPQARIIGRQVSWIPTRAADGHMLSPDALDQVCSGSSGARLLILNYPSNPTGRSLDAVTLEAIAEVARRHEVVVLSDEIYGEVHHTGAHRSIAEFYPEGTIISSGLSKWCGAGGWRLGYFLFPPELRWLADAMAVIASETFTSTSAPIQHAAIRAFEGGAEIEDYLRRSRAVLGAVAKACAATLRSAGVVVPEPEGGFYLFPDFGAHAEALAARGITTSAALCEAILDETGVAFLPGSNFGRPATELSGRIAYVDFDGEAALKAASDGLGQDFARTWCRDTVEACERIAEWLKG